MIKNNSSFNVIESWIYKHLDSISCLEFGDLNRNGKIEIIASTNKGSILIFSADGELLFETIACENSSIFCLKASDINGDGRKEILIGGMDGLLRVFKINNTYELEPFWAHQFGGVISGLLISDVNLDDIEEIMGYSLDRTLRILNPRDGSLVWGQIFEEGISKIIVLKRKQQDGGNIVLACGNDGTLRCFSGKKGEMMWFKRYSDKLRCLCSISTPSGDHIVCGGDDKKLHIVRESDRDEIRTIEFEDFVWKCLPIEDGNFVVSTYSFSFLEDNAILEQLTFSSMMCCVDPKLNVKWELKGINVEALHSFRISGEYHILFGTTKGEVMIIDPTNGNIQISINTSSCVNDIKFLPEYGMMFSCHDNGQIKAWSLPQG